MQQCEHPLLSFMSALLTFKRRTHHDLMHVTCCNHEKSQFFLKLWLPFFHNRDLPLLCSACVKGPVVFLLSTYCTTVNLPHLGLKMVCNEGMPVTYRARVWSVWGIFVYLYVLFWESLISCNILIQKMAWFTALKCCNKAIGSCRSLALRWKVCRTSWKIIFRNGFLEARSDGLNVVKRPQMEKSGLMAH